MRKLQSQDLKIFLSLIFNVSLKTVGVQFDFLSVAYDWKGEVYEIFTEAR